MDNNKKNTLKASKKKMTLASILVMAIFLLLMPLAFAEEATATPASDQQTQTTVDQNAQTTAQPTAEQAQTDSQALQAQSTRDNLVLDESLSTDDKKVYVEKSELNSGLSTQAAYYHLSITHDGKASGYVGSHWTTNGNTYTMDGHQVYCAQCGTEI